MATLRKMMRILDDGEPYTIATETAKGGCSILTAKNFTAAHATVKRLMTFSTVSSCVGMTGTKESIGAMTTDFIARTWNLKRGKPLLSKVKNTVTYKHRAGAVNPRHS